LQKAGVFGSADFILENGHKLLEKTTSLRQNDRKKMGAATASWCT